MRHTSTTLNWLFNSAEWLEQPPVLATVLLAHHGTSRAAINHLQCCANIESKILTATRWYSLLYSGFLQVCDDCEVCRLIPSATKCAPRQVTYDGINSTMMIIRKTFENNMTLRQQETPRERNRQNLEGPFTLQRRMSHFKRVPPFMQRSPSNSIRSCSLCCSFRSDVLEILGSHYKRRRPAARISELLFSTGTNRAGCTAMSRKHAAHSFNLKAFITTNQK